uniref:Uncharacterized protein n=1 Tax=Caudovirales sp. ct7964 TaxID=2825758 RepID=A0A8S5PEN9_9CAUD|nr:MAG TPA: hypothetical protein [Caudovirales sp. ct7964]
MSLLIVFLRLLTYPKIYMLLGVHSGVCAVRSCGDTPNEAQRPPG